MFCPNCGNQIPDGVAFCPNCGQSLGETPSPAAAAPAAETTVLPQGSSSSDAAWGSAQPTPTIDATMAAPYTQTPSSGADFRGYDTIPQPVSNEMPSQGSSAYYGQPSQPTGGFATQGAPAQPQYQQPVSQPAYTPGYGTQPTPTAPQKKSFLNSAGFKVGVATVIVAALVGVVVHFVLGGGSGGSSSSGSSSSSGGSTTTETIPTDTGTDSGSSSDTGSTSTTAPATRYDADATDYHGYPSLYAFMELSGSDLALLAEDQGFEYRNDEEYQIWVNQDVTMVFNVYSADGRLDDDQVRALAEGGAGVPTIYVTVFEGYSSCEDALKGMANCVIEDYEDDADGTIIAVLHGPSGNRFLCTVEDLDDGDYEIDLYNQDAISSDLFSEIWTSKDYGTTMESVFETFCGRSFRG